MQPIFIHVPRTGGTTIRAAFGEKITNYNHVPATDVRANDPDAWDAAWTFGFIRNPWQRAISFFDHTGLPPSKFEEWILNDAEQHLAGRNRKPQNLLCDESGTLMVDAVFRYEYFAAAIDELEARFGHQLPSLPHENKGPRWDRDARPLYGTASRDRIAEIGAWEIETFGYSF